MGIAGEILLDDDILIRENKLQLNAGAEKSLLNWDMPRMHRMLCKDLAGRCDQVFRDASNVRVTRGSFGKILTWSKID